MPKGIPFHTRLVKPTTMIKDWSSKQLMASQSTENKEDPSAWAETRALTAIHCAKNAELAILFRYLFHDTITHPSLPYGNAENRSIAGSGGGLNAPLPRST